MPSAVAAVAHARDLWCERPLLRPLLSQLRRSWALSALLLSLCAVQAHTATPARAWAICAVAAVCSDLSRAEVPVLW